MQFPLATAGDDFGFDAWKRAEGRARFGQVKVDDNAIGLPLPGGADGTLWSRYDDLGQIAFKDRCEGDFLQGGGSLRDAAKNFHHVGKGMGRPGMGVAGIARHKLKGGFSRPISKPAMEASV